MWWDRDAARGGRGWFCVDVVKCRRRVAMAAELEPEVLAPARWRADEQSGVPF